MTANRSPASPPRTWLFAALAIVVAGLIAHWPPARCEFVFDDIPLIVENQTVATDDLATAAFGRNVVMGNRPLTCLLLTIEHALFGFDARAFRFVSLALHLANALLLFAVARAALQAPRLAGRFAPERATWIAAFVAVAFAGHPLGVDAVGYAVQQSMLAMATCLLVALRGLQLAAATGRRGWLWLAVAATALGMACKEEFVAAPLVLVLYQRAFVADSWRQLQLPHRILAALAASWLVLLSCIFAGPRNSSAGYHVKPLTTAFEWLMTQAGVVLQYLRLAILPIGQRTYYDWEIVRSPAAALAPGLAVLALLVAVPIVWRRRPQLAWLWATTFLLLAPTSSILPLPTEVVAERRAYLPMLGVLVPLALALDALWQRRSAGAPRRLPRLAAIAALMGLLPVLARGRSAAYRDNLGYWVDAYAHIDPERPSFQQAFLLGNYAMVLRERGETARGGELLERVMQSDSPTPIQRTFYATALVDRGRGEEAEKVLRDALAEDPTIAQAHGQLASLLGARHAMAPARRSADDPELVEAETHARAAVALGPRRAAYVNILGWVLDLGGRTAEAEQLYRAAIALDPGRMETYFNYADMLQRLGRAPEAQALWRAMLASRPTDVRIRVRVAGEMLRRQNFPVAEFLLREAVRIDPTDAAATAALADFEKRRGR